MFLFSSPKQANYDKSNRITEVKMPIPAEAIILTEKLLGLTDAAERQAHGTELMDYLSDAAGIAIVELDIQDANQHHRRSGGKIVMKRYGSYRLSNRMITISNRTAARGQILAPKSFVDTLLHEWIHHYDTHKLKINSIHSAGFYARLNDLKDKLKIPKKTA